MKNDAYIQIKNTDNPNDKPINNKNFICLLIFKQIFLIIILFFITAKKNSTLFKKNNNDFKGINNNSINNYKFYNDELNYQNNTFIILIDNNCHICGLMAYYKHYLVCIRDFLSLGYIPIIDLISFPNIFNGFNITSIKKNPWELFFNQPFGYTLDNVLKYGKNINYSICKFRRKKLSYNIFVDKILIYYWHLIAMNYIPVNNQIINEANNKIEFLFKKSKNILGILIRGTDYVARKPKKHPIAPTSEMVIEDIMKMNKKNKYDYFFISTEDDLIREKFAKLFGKKIKFIKQKKINYNYEKKYFLAHNKNIKGNLYNMKIYLINIIILSKCIDIICARTSGSIASFIFTNGYRNSKVYFLGEYK